MKTERSTFFNTLKKMHDAFTGRLKEEPKWLYAKFTSGLIEF